MTNKPKENEGLPVSGYTPQSPSAIKAVNGFKEVEELLLQKLDLLEASDLNADPKWLNAGRIQIEQGFMAINRSIFKPQRFKT